MNAAFLTWCLSAISLVQLHADAPTRRVGPNGHKCIVIPAGTYVLGSADSVQNPTHEIKLASFSIAEAETTNAQFAAFVEATKYVTDAERLGSGKVAVEGMGEWKWELLEGAHWRKPMGVRGPEWKEIPQHPVTQISGADALAYCAWLKVRLPTLDEWEVAARAGAKTLYPWGNDFDPKRANIWNGETHQKNTQEDGFLYTAPVKSFPPNPWGLYDVIGNVFEYCSGLPAGSKPEDEARLMAGRGGSWWCSFGTCHYFNLVDIGTMVRQGSLSNQGFRVVVN